jgi:hypothetical protein
MRTSSGRILLIISACLFGAFFANVMLGATGKGVFLTDVQELLVLFASCALFVAATLQFEKNQKQAARAAQVSNK